MALIKTLPMADTADRKVDSARRLKSTGKSVEVSFESLLKSGGPTLASAGVLLQQIAATGQASDTAKAVKTTATSKSATSGTVAEATESIVLNGSSKASRFEPLTCVASSGRLSVETGSAGSSSGKELTGTGRFEAQRASTVTATARATSEKVGDRDSSLKPGASQASASRSHVDIKSAQSSVKATQTASARADSESTVPESRLGSQAIRVNSLSSSAQRTADIASVTGDDTVTTAQVASTEKAARSVSIGDTLKTQASKGTDTVVDRVDGAKSGNRRVTSVQATNAEVAGTGASKAESQSARGSQAAQSVRARQDIRSTAQASGSGTQPAGGTAESASTKTQVTNATTNASASAVRSGNVEDAVISQVRLVMDGDSSKATVRLDPPNLGQLKIEVDCNSGVSIKVTASTPEALALLRNGADGLKQTLQNFGVNVDSLQLGLDSSHGGSGQDTGEAGRGTRHPAPVELEAQRAEAPLGWSSDLVDMVV